MAITVNTERRQDLEAAVGVAACVLLLVLLAGTPTVVPVSWWWGSCRHTLSLGPRTEIQGRVSGSPYRDPELPVGRWTYRVTILPRLGFERSP